MNYRNIVIGILSVALVSTVGFSLTRSKPTTTSNTVPPTKSLGALTGPIIPFDYFSFGGVLRFAARTESLVQSTTTICALQSPAATSTLVSGSVQLRVSSSTATRITIANSSTAFATTTGVLATTTIAANGQGELNALATSSVLYDSKIRVNSLTFAPSAWMVVGMQGGIGTFSPTGSCNATWEVF